MVRRYVIKKGKRYVNYHDGSYTSSLYKAMLYESKKVALNDSQDDEYIVPVDMILREVTNE